ncbi:hypothetical protein AAG906_038528 [Vitis piasezkii]
MTIRGIPSPTSIHFTIDGRHVVPSISEGHGPHFIQEDLYRFNPYSEGASTWDTPLRCEGFYFGPHHLIMASLVHFEEKVHRKKLQRTDTIPMLFPRSPSYGSTSRAPTDGADTIYSSTYKAGRASDKDYTTCPCITYFSTTSLLPPPRPNLPASSKPLAPIEDTIPAEDTTTIEVQIPPPQEATTDAIASVDPQDEPQTVDIVTTTLEDASSPPEAPTT